MRRLGLLSVAYLLAVVGSIVLAPAALADDHIECDYPDSDAEALTILSNVSPGIGGTTPT